MSSWDRLSYRFRATWEAATRIVENEDSNLGISVYNSVQSTTKTTRWSEYVRAIGADRDWSPLTPRDMDSIAYSFLRVGLPVDAVDCYTLIEKQGWRMPWFDRYSHAYTLFMLRRFEEAIDVFQTIVNDDCDGADSSRLQQAYCLRFMGRFDEADELFSTIQQDSIVDTQQWFHLSTAMTKNDAAAAFEILTEIFSDQSDPDDIMSDEFCDLASRPFLAWLLGRESDYQALLKPVTDARDRWLAEHEDSVSPRRSVVIHADDQLRALRADVMGAVVLVRADQDVTDDQLDQARTLAKKIRQTSRQRVTNSSDRTLQGLLYGNDDFLVRDIDWEVIDSDLRLEGDWHVVDLSMDRIFLPTGKLENDLVDIWMSTTGKGVYQHVLCGELDPTTKRDVAMPVAAAASLLTEPAVQPASQ